MAETQHEYKNVEIVRSGTAQIHLPEDMSYKQAREWLTKKEQEEMKPLSFREDIIGPYPVDALIALHKATSEIYGWKDLRPTPGFFGDTPPLMISFNIGPNETIQVPYGSIALPTIDGTLGTHINIEKGVKPSFIIAADTLQRSIPKLKEIAQRTKEILKTDSIYKGKAIRVSWEWKRSRRDFNLAQDIPTFMSLDEISEKELIFADEVKRQLKIGLFTPIEYSAACRAIKIPLKRGVLLEGPYGTGKSLTALVTAKKAVDSGWTFLYLDNVLDLKDALELARYYAPAVVFGEDVDRIIGDEERDSRMDDLLNCLDGIDSKQHEIITVLTTNHVNKIQKAFVRPGRIDTIVSITPPDGKAAAELVQLYGRGMFSDTTKFDVIGDRLKGKIPAVIREIVERAKIATISRIGGTDSPIGRVNEDDIADSATTIENHEKILSDNRKSDPEFKLDDMVVRIPREALEQMNHNDQ